MTSLNTACSLLFLSDIPGFSFLKGVFMFRRLLTLTSLSLVFLFTTAEARAGFTEYVARCVEIGHDMDTSRVYSLHVNEKKDTGILVAIDTDKLTEVEYGPITFTGNHKVGRKITMPIAHAVFTDVVGDAGGDATIRGVKYTCDFSQ
jgi:hypothetical protein